MKKKVPTKKSGNQSILPLDSRSGMSDPYAFFTLCFRNNSSPSHLLEKKLLEALR